jgi:leader peptidase (prepilin peptidase)/N-methyltransferase
MIVFLILVLGLFFGSFLNVVVDRLQNKQSFISGRSKCDFCKKELAWFDLIPLLSFILIRGKCRYCRKKLSYYYPVTELSTGTLFSLAYLCLGPQPLVSLVYYLFITSCFIVIFFSDLKYGIIPDKIILPATVGTVIYLLIFNPQLLIINLLSAIGAGLFFLALFLFTKGKGMGFGDVKLALLLGLFLGFPKVVFALYLAFLTGAIVGLMLIIWKKKKTIKETIPFGPFLILASLIGLFWGNFLIPKIAALLGLL